MASSSSWGDTTAAGGAENRMEDDDDVMTSTADNTAGAGGATSVEDQLGLLQQQLSCLRTNDKDVLVSQFQKIVGPSLNTYAAHFFLDMNNWNVQLAVGSYFDLIGGGGAFPTVSASAASEGVVDNFSAFSTSASVATTEESMFSVSCGRSSIPHITVDPPPPQSLIDCWSSLGGTTPLYSATVISIGSSDSTVTSSLSLGGGESLCVVHSAPGRRATIHVVVRNSGHAPWPTGTRLAFVQGNANFVCDHQSNLATNQPVQPQERCELLLTLLVPVSVGVPSEVLMEFRIVTPDGLVFRSVGVNNGGSTNTGDPIKVRVEVEDDDALSRRMMLLST